MTESSTLPREEFPQIAKEIRLRYVADTIPGIKRERKHDTFVYTDTNNQLIKDTATLNRITTLRIPPAWNNVWISPYTNSHLQATGKDEKGRKQYLYHDAWTAYMQQNKFDKLLAFSDVLPAIRQHIAKDMQDTSLSEKKVLATTVWLLDHTYMRVGNEEYAKQNEHFGLTTLHNDHVSIHGASLQFHYIGKSGKEQTVEVMDRKIARIIHRLEELPGFELFQYVDSHGGRHPIDSSLVNEYLKEISSSNISAKDFRTWGATVLAGQTFYHTYPEFLTKKEEKKNVVNTIKEVARHLHNTTTVCRTYYIHPSILKAYSNKQLVTIFQEYHEKTPTEWKSHDEEATRALLQKDT